MPRFGDKWVVDRSNFDYVSGGSCQCCGFSHLFMPNGLRGLIGEVSDLETDAANAEFNAAQNSPWPPDMRDQVWGDRVKLRHFMKKEMKGYKAAFPDRDELIMFLKSTIGPGKLRNMLQMGREEVTDRIHDKYDIHSAYRVVMVAVTEQVANFPLTKLPQDARGEEEARFEETLMYDRRGGFMFPIASRDDDGEFFFNDTNLSILVDMLMSLGGPKLLKRAPRLCDMDSDDDEEGGADEVAETKQSDGPSFRSDRRIIRLLIARNWADNIIEKLNAAKTI